MPFSKQTRRSTLLAALQPLPFGDVLPGKFTPGFLPFSLLLFIFQVPAKKLLFGSDVFTNTLQLLDERIDVLRRQVALNALIFAVIALDDEKLSMSLGSPAVACRFGDHVDPQMCILADLHDSWPGKCQRFGWLRVWIGLFILGFGLGADHLGGF